MGGERKEHGVIYTNRLECEGLLAAGCDADDRDSTDGDAPNRVGGGLTAPVLPHHRTYSSYPAVSPTVATQRV